jgi:hypothetical protein
MTKYEQALIRKELKTLISLPLMPPKADKENADPLAILSIDSDNNLMKQFFDLGSPAVQSDLSNLVTKTAERLAVELSK